MRPSLTLARYSNRVKAAATANHLRDVRVFGSVARGLDTDRSDVDLLVSRDRGGFVMCRDGVAR